VVVTDAIVDYIGTQTDALTKLTSSRSKNNIEPKTQTQYKAAARSKIHPHL
jgi:hypothetical protein